MSKLKTRRTRAEAQAHRDRLASLAASGGSLHLVVDDEGTFVVLEGLPHVEIPGATLSDALRALAAQIEEAEEVVLHG